MIRNWFLLPLLGFSLTLTTVCLQPQSANAGLDADTNCQVRKLNAAAAYARCHYKKLAEAVGSESSPDFTSCENRLTGRWENFDALGGEDCPNGFGSIGDILAELGIHSGAVSVLLDNSSEGETRCERAKISVAGDYENCRLREHAKAARKGRGPNFFRCDRVFSRRWALTDARFGADCPNGAGVFTTGDSLVSDGSATLICMLTSAGICGSTTSTTMPPSSTTTLPPSTTTTLPPSTTTTLPPPTTTTTLPPGG